MAGEKRKQQEEPRIDWTEDPTVNLLIAVVKRAQLDASRGDPKAQSFLAWLQDGDYEQDDKPRAWVHSTRFSRA